MADLTGMLQAASGSGGGEPDPNFNQTVLLLHGDGTNGAQNNTFLDSSTNNFTITRNGNTTQGTFSPFSVAEGQWSNYFDGTGDYLSSTVNTSLDVSANTDFTIEGWCYLTARVATRPAIFSNYNSFTTGGLSFWAGHGSATITQFQVALNGTFPALDAGTIPYNSWFHWAIVRNGTASNNITVYINGTSIGTISSNVAITATGNSLWLGASGDATANAGINGYMSNFRWVSGTALYTGNFTPSTSPLTAVSGTEFLTCQSNRFVDNSSNAFAITVAGTPSVQPFSPFAPSAAYSASVNGGSGYFDGSGDSLSVPDDADLDFGAGDYTIECWLYRNNTTDDMAVIDGRSGISTGYLIALATGNKILWFVNASLITGSTTIGSGTWYHIAITRSGTSVKLFVNGAEDGSTTDSTSTNSGAISIGSKSAGASASSIVNFNGYIANIRIVKGTAVYTSAFTPPTAPPTAIANTQLLLNYTNAGIFDNTGKNNLETVGNAQIDTTTVKYGTGSMEFDGTGDYLLIPNTESLNLGTGDFTMEFWVYVNAGTSGFRGLIAKQTTLTTNEWRMAFTDGTYTPNLYIVNGTKSINAPTVSTGTWTHIAFVRSNGTVTGYTDGVAGTPVASVTGTLSNTAPFYIGSNQGVYLNGFIDDLRITKGVARYTTTFTPPTAAFPDL